MGSPSSPAAIASAPRDCCALREEKRSVAHGDAFITKLNETRSLRSGKPPIGRAASD